MKNLTNSKWLLLLNTLPISFIFIFFGFNFSVLKHALKEENVHHWITFGSVLAVYGVFNILYAVLRKRLSLTFTIFSLFFSISYIYFFFVNHSEIIPKDVPNWMLSENLSICVLTFLMPTIAFTMINLVLRLTKAENSSALFSFVYMITIPFLWFLFAQIALPFANHRSLNSKFIGHSLTILFIGGVILFFFFLCRFFYIVFSSKNIKSKSVKTTLKVIIAIACPIAGLIINQTPSTSTIQAGIFGDFSSYWFYVLAIVNGIFVCLPNLEKNGYRFTLFLFRSFTFSFILYFHTVFLPFLPLAIIAILLGGGGFLMLTPVTLFIVQIIVLNHDFSYLKQFYSNKLLISLATLMTLVLPSLVITKYVNDRNTLHNALQYISAPDYTKEYKINTDSLADTLQVVRQHKQSDDHRNYGRHLPYLSTLYNWIVLDNLTLADSKIEEMEKIFFANSDSKKSERRFGRRRRNFKFSEAKVKSIDSESHFQNGYWTSWIHLQLENDKSNETGEFITNFELPEGCWISDYYLYVGEKKKMGLLAEKRSAQWIYNQIRNDEVPRDPGILTYADGNSIKFKVFPFKSGEVRKTGFQLIHKESINFNFNDNALLLGEQNKRLKNCANFISINDIKQLPKVSREPYIHFIINRNSNQKHLNTSQQIQEIQQHLGIIDDNYKVTICDAFTTTFSASDNWQKELKKESQGGFFLERAIKQVLVRNYLESSAKLPIIIVLDSDIEKSILNDSFSDLEFTFPEGDQFYSYSDKKLYKHHLLNKPKQKQECSELKLSKKVYAFPNLNKTTQYISLNSQGTVTIPRELPTMTNDSKIDKALHSEQVWNYLQLYPNLKESHWLNMVKTSFSTNIMNQFTSFIVLENEMQEAALKKKQQQVLKGKSYLDLEEITEMPEPQFWLILTMMLTFILWHRNRQRKQLFAK